MPPKPTRRARTRKPHQPTLTRDRVLSEALALLDRDGLEALNMRGLAKHLGVTPMALYNHVSNKEDLLHGIAAVVIEQMRFEYDPPDGRTRSGPASGISGGLASPILASSGSSKQPRSCRPPYFGRWSSP